MKAHISVEITRAEYQQLRQMGERLMATLDELKTHIADLGTAATAISTGLQDIATEIQDLKDQLAGGTLVTQADLDSLDDSVQAVRTQLQQVLTDETSM